MIIYYDYILWLYIMIIYYGFSVVKSSRPFPTAQTVWSGTQLFQALVFSFNHWQAVSWESGERWQQKGMAKGCR